MNIDKLLVDVATHRAKVSFYDQSPETLKHRQDLGLGMAIAYYCRWDGIRIMKIFSAALEDANFHSESKQVDEMIEALKPGA